MPGGQRRTPGLRREEVAVLAGVSVSWYTWLEQGRDVQPSAGTLRRLGEVLRLDRAEVAHLFALSHRDLPPSPSDDRLSDGLDQLVQAMDPIAAYVRNARFDILAWNTAVTRLFVDYGTLPADQRNTLWLMFRYLPYRTLIVEWEQMARGYLAAFRAARAKASDPAPFDRLVADLTEASPEFRAWWPEVDVSSFDEGSKSLRHPTLGHVDFKYVSLTSERQPGLSIVAYVLQPPAGERHS